MTSFAAQLDELPRPIWFALAILGFIFWWPLGLAVMAYSLWSGKMACCGLDFGNWRNDTSRPLTGLVASAENERQPSLRRIPDCHVAAIGRGAARVSRTFCRACAQPRTRPSSTNSWPNVAPDQSRVRRNRQLDMAQSIRIIEDRNDQFHILCNEGATHEIRLHNRGPLRLRHARNRAGSISIRAGLPPAHRDYTARGGVTANAARDDANDADDAKDAQRRDAPHGHDGRFLHGTGRHNPKCRGSYRFPQGRTQNHRCATEAWDQFADALRTNAKALSAASSEMMSGMMAE